MQDSVTETMDAVLRLLREQDSGAAVEHLARWGDALDVAREYAALVDHLYWKQKDLQGVVLLSRAGIQHGLAAALAVEETDPDRAYELRSTAKAMAFNLASFTWPGWDEPGITIDARDCAIGLDAARTNLRLAVELNKGDLPLSRGRWMLGAHLLTAGRGAEARKEFDEAAVLAGNADAPGEVLLCRGFACLAALLPTPGDAAIQASLESIKNQLNEMKEGSFFTSQIETAARVLGLSLSSAVQG